MNRLNKKFELGKELALRCLDRRMHTRKELLDKLKLKGYDESIVDYIQELGYINDKDYAMRYTRDACNIKRWGAGRIRVELRRRGVADEIINKALADADIDFNGNLRSLIESRAQGLDLNDDKQKRRLFGFLQRRGYRSGEISQAMEMYK